MALSLESLAYSSWMVNTRTDSSWADAFSSMDFFLLVTLQTLAPPPPERGGGGNIGFGGMVLVGMQWSVVQAEPQTDLQMLMCGV